MIGTVVVALAFAAVALVLAWATVHLSLRARRAQARLSKMAALTTSAISEIASGPVEVVGAAVPWRITIGRDGGSSTSRRRT